MSLEGWQTTRQPTAYKRRAINLPKASHISMIAFPNMVYCLSLLTGSLMPSLAIAGDTHSLDSIGSWTLYNFARFCQNDGSTCLYTFGIEEDPDSCVFSPCVFTVDAKDGKPANQTDFQEIDCLNMEWFKYKINGGWDPSGYMTLVVTNTGRQANAYFSFNDGDTEKGKVVASQSRPAYHVGSFSRDEKLLTTRHTEEVKHDNDIGEWWQIQDMLRRELPLLALADPMRRCSDSRATEVDTTTGIVDLTFKIQDSDGGKPIHVRSS